MQSPFPGMDPYLENPAVWRDFHTDFLANIRAAFAETYRRGAYHRLLDYLARPDVCLSENDVQWVTETARRGAAS